jgi:hypothetical protein
LEKSELIKFIMGIPQLYVFVQFLILYRMAFGRGLHRFCMLSYLSFKNGANLKSSKEILKFKFKAGDLVFFHNVARSLLNTAMLLEMLFRFFVFQNTAFLLSSGPKNHGSLENLLPSILNKSVR